MELETLKRVHLQNLSFQPSASPVKEESKGIIINTNLALPLPQHISLVIFSKIPICNLPASMLVSKSWNHLIYTSSNSKFFPNIFLFSTCEYDREFRSSYNSKIHRLDCDTFDSSFEFHFPDEYVSSMSIENHCNGLLFIRKFGYGCCKGILNPMTTEFFQIPISYFSLFHGFGFIPKTKRYKLFICEKTSSDKFEIFSFGRDGFRHNQWRSASLPCPFNICSNGAYLDGVIYWIAKENGNENVICALDVEAENFKLIGVLDVGPHSCRAELQCLNGTIYAIVSLKNKTMRTPQIQIWRMEKNDSWIRACIFQPPIYGSICLVRASKDGGIWFQQGKDLFCLDRYGKMINKKTLFQNDIHVQLGCPIEFLHFGSLSKILAGDE